MQLKKTITAFALGLGVAAFAQAAPIYLGELSISNPILDSYTANPNLLGGGGNKPFYDQYTFTVADDLLGISGPTAYSSVASFDLVSVLFNITNLTISVYSGDTVDAANLVFEKTANAGASFVKEAFALESSVYTFVISGATTGQWGGSYTINLVGAAAPVPEPAEYAMLLAGLGVVGMVVRRRKMNVN